MNHPRTPCQSLALACLLAFQPALEILAGGAGMGAANQQPIPCIVAVPVSETQGGANSVDANRAPVPCFVAVPAPTGSGLDTGHGRGLPGTSDQAERRSGTGQGEATDEMDATPSPRERSAPPHTSPRPSPVREPVRQAARTRTARAVPEQKLAMGGTARGFTRGGSSGHAITVDSFNIPESSLDREELDAVLRPLTHKPLTLAELKTGVRRLLLEAYRARGIDGVQILIPPQKILNRALLVEVIEPKLGETVIEGNRWFGDKNIMRFFAGKVTNANGVLMVKKLERALEQANRHPDRQVVAILKPGKTEGATDLTFRVTEREALHGIPPLHYTLGVSNTGSPKTGRMRVTHSLQHTNVLDKDHILSVQWQHSPTYFDRVQAVAGSYQIPIGTTGHALSLYGGYSRVATPAVLDSMELFGDSFSTGAQLDLRMPEYWGVQSVLTLGLEGARSKNSLEYGGVTALESRLGLLPLTARYTFHRPDATGVTTGRFSIRGNVPGVMPDGDAADIRVFRPGAPATFWKARLGVGRQQKLTEKWALNVNFEGQYTPDDLIPGEQLHLGGHGTVRGYDQSGIAGDTGFFVRTEIVPPSFPAVLSRMTASRKDDLRIIGFLDYGLANLEDDTTGQSRSRDLLGTGLGFRYRYENLEGVLDLAWALFDTGGTDRGDLSIHFSLQASF